MTTYNDVFSGDSVPPASVGLASYTTSVAIELSWPEYPVTDFVTAKIVEVDASIDLDVTLPDATEASNGEDLLIRAIGAGILTIKDQSGNTVTTIDPGVSKFIYLSDNSTVNGVWDSLTFGATTSTATAGDLDGAGLRANGLVLDQNIPTRSVLSTYTVVEADRARLILAGGGSYSIALPAAASVGEGFFTSFNNNGSGTITIDPNGAETIDGASTKTLLPGGSFTAFCDGVGWYSVGYGRDIIFAFSEYTITATSGTQNLLASDVSGRMIRIANALTGNMTINLPATVGVYFLKATSWGGGFSATIQVTGGIGSSVQVTTGQSIVLYSDGTNIFSGNTVSVMSSLALADGSSSGPSLYFLSDVDTGVFREGANQLGITAGAFRSIRAHSTGAQFYGDVTAPTQALGDSSTKLATTAFVAAVAFAAALPAQAGNNGKFVTTDGAVASWVSILQVPAVATHAGKFLFTDGATPSWQYVDKPWVTRTANYTAVAGDRIQADTNAVGAWTLTLPATPNAGDRVWFKDYAGSFATNNLTVARNGSKIENLAEDMTVSTNYASVCLEYIDATAGWKIV